VSTDGVLTIDDINTFSLQDGFIQQRDREGDNICDASYAPFDIATYNCRGYNQFKEAFVRQLLSECNVLCLQEHWLSEAQIPILSAISKQFLSTGVCGFSDSAAYRLIDAACEASLHNAFTQ
jgi:hypothetical protein